MALSPFAIEEEQQDDAILEQGEMLPSKTYEFNFDTGRFTSFMIDEDEALKQFIRKALATARFRYLIYSEDFGSELEDLIGQDITIELLETEIPRLITEALIYDDRIESCENFTITKDKDEVYATFTVIKVDGTVIEIEEVIE